MGKQFEREAIHLPIKHPDIITDRDERRAMNILCGWYGRNRIIENCTISIKVLKNGAFASGDRLNRLLIHLSRCGYIKYSSGEGIPQDIELTHDGINYFETKARERKKFIVSGVLIPIALSVITSLFVLILGKYL